jgi:hypothetical protein
MNDYLDELYDFLKQWYRRDFFDFRSALIMLNKTTSIVDLVMEGSKRRKNFTYHVAVGGEATLIEYIPKEKRAIIWLQNSMFTTKWWADFGVDPSKYNVGLLTLGLGIANVFHEVLHARFTQFEDKNQAFELSKHKHEILRFGSGARKLWDTIVNLVEDLYINNLGYKLFPNSFGYILFAFYNFLIYRNPSFNGAFEHNPLSVIDAAVAINFGIGGIDFDINRQLSNGKPLSGLMDIVAQIFTLDETSVSEDRTRIADEIYEYIHDENQEKKLSEDNKERQLKKSAPIGTPSIESKDSNKPTDDRERYDLHNAKDSDRDNPKGSDEELQALKELRDNSKTEITGIGSDHHQTTFKTTIVDPPNTTWNRFNRLSDNKITNALRKLMRLKFRTTSHERSYASDSGSKLNNRGLADPKTMLLKYQERKLQEKPLQIILLIDQSGSMSQRYHGSTESFNVVVAKHALEWWTALTNLGLKCWVYNHTTSTRENNVVVTRILNPSTPKSKALTLIQNATTVDMNNNLDAQAVLAVVEDTREKRDGHTVILVMSDGRPNSVGEVTGEDALRDLVRILPQQNIELWGCALVEGVVSENKAIYGANCIDGTKDLDRAIEKFVTTVMSKNKGK